MMNRAAPDPVGKRLDPGPHGPARHLVLRIAEGDIDIAGEPTVDPRLGGRHACHRVRCAASGRRTAISRPSSSRTAICPMVEM